jgi:hypothetical protein
MTMKNLKPILLICMFMAIISASCKKSDNNISTSISVSLKFNGSAKSSSTVIADYIKSESNLQVIGKFGNEAVSISIANIKVGTFDVATDGALVSYATTADFSNTYLGTTGTVVITSFTSDKVTGTFNFVGTTIDGRNGTVTEGKFSAKVINQ